MKRGQKSDETCHKFEWKRLADELSEKYPELGNIERYAVKNTETGVAFMDKEYIAQWAMKNVMLKQEYNNKIYYFVVPVTCKDWKDLQNALSTGTTVQKQFCGKWTRLFSTLDPHGFVQLRVFRDMSRFYYEIPKEMIRRERELGSISFDEENASISGMSQEAIDKWRDSHIVLLQTPLHDDNGYERVYVFKRTEQAVIDFLKAIKFGTVKNPLFNGEWCELILTRNPRYFISLAPSKGFSHYYQLARLTSRPLLIDHKKYLGIVNAKFEIHYHD